MTKEPSLRAQRGNLSPLTQSRSWIAAAFGLAMTRWMVTSAFMPFIGTLMLLFGMSIQSSLFTDSQVRLFPWLFGRPDRAYHLSELRRLTGLGSASVQRELNRLADAGLLESRAVGNMRQFQANPKAPVFNELVSLTRKTMGTVPVLQQALAPLQPDLIAASVYGSVAKQTDTAQSDVDVLLVGTDLSLRNLEKLT